MWLCRPSMDGRLTQRPAGRMLGFQGFICLARAGGQRSGPVPLALQVKPQDVQRPG